MSKLTENFKSKLDKTVNSSLYKGLLKYITAAIIISIPLYPKFPLLAIPGSYVTVRIEDFLIAVATFLWLLLALNEPKKFIKDKINQAIILYIFIGFVSLISAAYLTKTVYISLGTLHWIRRIEYLSLFFLGRYVLTRGKYLSFYVKCIFLVIFVLFFYAFGQKYFNFPIITTQNYEYSKGIALRYTPGAHIPSTFAGHYDLATYIILVAPLVFTLFLTLKSKLKKIISIIAIFSCYWLLVNSISRISIVSFVGSISLALILIKKTKAIPILIITTILFISLSSDLIGRYTRVFEVSIKEIMEQTEKINFDIFENSAWAASDTETTIRRSSSQSPTPLPVFEDRSTSIRLNVEWPRAIRAFSKNPILGTGFSSITLATDNHYLRLLGEIGLLGFFAFFLIFARILKIYFEVIPIKKPLTLEKIYLASVMGVIPGIFLNAVFIDVFEASKVAIMFWLFVGFSLTVAKNIKKE